MKDENNKGNKKEIQEIEIEATEEKGVAIQEEVPYKFPVTKVEKENFSLTTLNTPNKLLEFANIIIQAKMCSFKEPADAVVALVTGQELGIGLSAVLGGVYVIEGRPSLGVHVKKAILLNNNVLYRKTRDMEVYFEFATKKDGKVIVQGYGYLDEQPKGTLKKPIDTKTEYIFTRHFRTMKGIVTNTAKGIFSISEATSAGLMGKGTWQKYTRDLLSSRAFSRGANEIADDLLNGMLSFSELADINDGVTYYIDENGHEQIVK